MKFAWKIVNQEALEVNNELFSMYKPMRRQGPSIHFYEPFSRTTALQRLPSASVPHYWNKAIPFFY